MTSSSSSPAPDAAPILLHAIDHAVWEGIASRLASTCEAHGEAVRTAPLLRLMHDLLDTGLRQLHLRVFRDVLTTEVGLPLGDDDAAVYSLYLAELAQHGVSNIVVACQARNLHAEVAFPSAGPVRVALSLPCRLLRLPEPYDDSALAALGCTLNMQTAGESSHIVICAGQSAAPPPTTSIRQLPPDEVKGHVAAIGLALGYGCADFSATGELLALSPNLPALLGMPDAASLAAALPAVFFEEAIWNPALTGDGRFENYRLRLSGADSGHSILFNVSGFRAPDRTIRTLWQIVSQGVGEAPLGQGAILAEARVSNITRHYVPQLVEHKAREAVRLGRTALIDEERALAVLFCDIVGFTSYVERHAQGESVVSVLNTLLRRISVPVKHHRGHIDKFMGDAVMAVFDAPADALEAALDMQRHADDVNTQRLSAARQVLRLRVGIHWGMVTIGNVGTPERLDWTAIGDTVNTAARIEKACPPGGVLVSAALREAVEAAHPGRFCFGETYPLQVKGKHVVLDVCCVEDATT